MPTSQSWYSDNWFLKWMTFVKFIKCHFWLIVTFQKIMLKRAIITARHLPKRERAIIQLHYSQSYTNCIVTARSTICAWRSISLDAVTLLHVTAQKAAANWTFGELGFRKENPLKMRFTLVSPLRWGYQHLCWRQTRAGVIGCCCRTQVLHLYWHGCAPSRHKIPSPIRTAVLTTTNDQQIRTTDFSSFMLMHKRTENGV